MSSLRYTKSFRVVSEYESDHLTLVDDTPKPQLLVFPLHLANQDEDGAFGTAVSPPSQMKLGCVDLDTLGDQALGEDTINLTVAGLVEGYAAAQLDLMGFALRCSSTTQSDHIHRLVKVLHERNVSCILMVHHDTATGLMALDLSLAAGIIIENACILPDGQPRDYFQSRPLRNVMIKCARERERRADFFIGYLDQWLQRPHPSVIKRALKIAEHYGAVLEHGAFDNNSETINTIGGFEYLRRAEIVDLQRSWTDSDVSYDGGDDKVARFAIGADVGRILPGVAVWLEDDDLPAELDWLQNQVAETVHPPQYLSAYPAGQTDFWEQDQDGRHLVTLGCFPLGVEPLIEHYMAIVTEQTHLCQLNMLHPVVGSEKQSILTLLRSMAGDPRIDVAAVHELIHGLSTSTIRVHKGLQTGFRVPNSNISFWGVSHEEEQAGGADIEARGVDIYVSQASPNDACVILHTWLAHRGRPRIDRIQHEAVLERRGGGDVGNHLPLTIRTALDGCSPAELLLLVQRLRLSGPNIPLGDTIHAYIRSLLIDKTTKSTWTTLCARKALDGTMMDVVELISLRLEHHARNGATRLPRLESLVQMYMLVDEAIIDALFYGWHDVLSPLTQALLDCYTAGAVVDVAADMFALVFFTSLRRAAFEDVYFESTDRCPLFLNQPDQAAVFSELWTLGSQCENYFGMVPRDIGDIIYHRRRAALDALGAPTAADRVNNEIMTMYASTDDAPPSSREAILKMFAESPATPAAKLSPLERLEVWRLRLSTASAMSIFSVPAIIDVVLLTFVGRGLFMTAYMAPHVVQAAGYALLTSLLLTAGVVGWVGSAGSHYLPQYAYDSIILFHVQRLSGGFVLAVVISALGLVGFAITISVGAGLVFAGYLVALSTYLNLLGIMSTMHQHGSPLPSGRNVFLQTFPLLLVAPLLSFLVNGHDLLIHLCTLYGFLGIAMVRYRRLCHQWSTWMDNIPTFKSAEIVEWYHGDKKDDDAPRNAFAAAIASYRRGEPNTRNDPLVAKVAKGLPYVDWLFKKTTAGGQGIPEMFTPAWFTAVDEAISQHRQLSRGLKDHNAMTLFRIARYDLGQNLGLFLVALLDRWVMLVMSARQPYPTIYAHDEGRARYAFCFSIVYFCLGSMVLDATLSKYWSIRDVLSTEPLANLAHAQRVAQEAEAARKDCVLKAFTEVVSKLLVIFGAMTFVLWLFVDATETTAMYYMYMFGYTCCLMFQVSRCFTTNVAAHVRIIFLSAAIGFVVGVLLHAFPATAGFLYTDLVAQNTAASLAACGTILWTYQDWNSTSALQQSLPDESAVRVHVQSRSMAPPAAPPPPPPLSKAFTLPTLLHSHGTGTSRHITELLRLARDKYQQWEENTQWPTEVLQETLNMWTSGQMSVAVLSRQHFAQAGLAHCSTVSYHDGSQLHVAVCFAQPPGWISQILPNIVAEALLYHVAHVHLGLTENQALRAEHLLQGHGRLSTRLEADMALMDPGLLGLFACQARKQLMEHLCLDIDVDTQWDALPLDTRSVIFSRIDGRPSKYTADFDAWAVHQATDIETADFGVRLCREIYRLATEQRGGDPQAAMSPQRRQRPSPPDIKPASPRPSPWRKIVSMAVGTVKWIALITCGDSNVERELYHLVGGHGVTLCMILGIWKACWWLKHVFVYWIILYQRPTIARISRLATKGARRKIYKNRIVVELGRQAVTAFASVDGDDGGGTMTLQGWNGVLSEVPSTGMALFDATYDSSYRLRYRRNIGGSTSTYRYDSSGSSSRRPTSVTVINTASRSIGFYDEAGRVVNGSLWIGGTHLVFRYHYKGASGSDAHVLRADYSSGNNMLSIFWGSPVDTDDYTWVPSKNVGLIIRRIGAKTYTTEYDYSHRRDPVTTTYLEELDGHPRTAMTEAPKIFAQEADLLGVPTNHSFELDDLVIGYSASQLGQMCTRASYNPFRWLLSWQKRSQYARVPTWLVRTQLWNQWLNTSDLNAVTACCVDELILREEPLLKPYWRARDRGQLELARRQLDANISQIVSAINIDTDISERTLLAIRTSDLYAMGLAQDSNAVTTRPQDCYSDDADATGDRLSVIFNDIGCWPVAPGGVSNCRRDLVNGHSTIRNHVLAECANDYGIPRFQVEKNVQSLKLLPLWGLDANTAKHGLLENHLESEVDAKVDRTDVRSFIPLLDAFVKGCRMRRLQHADLLRLSNVILAMAKYYESHDYARTWRSAEVEQAWIAAWLKAYDDPNIVDPAELYDIARPSMFDFRQALYLYLAYFFIFSVRIPEQCPRVFQATHHGISSLFGMVLKYRRGVTFGIWDHAILWRESCLNFSVAQCQLPVAVQNMLLSGIGVATRLAYFHADVVMPCASLFNPMWETELGSDGSRVCSRSVFKRKIDPIVNGISNMDGFTPVDKVRTAVPTVVMLSNVQFIKGVKVAIQAADIIVNQFGFKDYRLVVYGAKDRQPSYCLEMEKMIVDNQLSSHVSLAGFGNAKEVLKDAWLFMNSSISEGLPLAIGEAALAGVPIVATEVGATAQVLTDPDNPNQRYGEVVPPNNPMGLARAQIAVLAMAGPWAKFTGLGDCALPDIIGPDDVDGLTRRFYDLTEDRRKLGLLSRNVVLHSFHGSRYLREHEQMYWIQWHMARMRANAALRPAPFRFGSEERYSG